LVINGFAVPGQNDTDLLTVLEAVPGAILGYALFYVLGVRKEAAEGGDLEPLPGH
jgi:hypothetical protein